MESKKYFHAGITNGVSSIFFNAVWNAKKKKFPARKVSVRILRQTEWKYVNNKRENRLRGMCPVKVLVQEVNISLIYCCVFHVLKKVDCEIRPAEYLHSQLKFTSRKIYSPLSDIYRWNLNQYIFIKRDALPQINRQINTE